MKLLLVLCMLPLTGTAQLFANDEYKYSTEVIWGISKDTRGGFLSGLMLRYGRSAGKDVFTTYGLALSNVKHRMESRQVGLQGRGFIYGKSNYLYAVRLQYGKEKLVFRKADQQGVQINVGAAAGPVIGLVTPYYVLTKEGEYVPFSATDPNLASPASIAGPGRLFQGLREAKAVPGVNARGSVSFEFGTYKSSVIGLEMGLLVEAYTKKIIIVPTQPNDSVYTSLFLALFWGTRS